MIKVINVKQIDENIFDVFVSNFGKPQHYNVLRRFVFLQEIDKSMPFLNCEEQEFSNIYGYSSELRQDIWNLIKQAESVQVQQLSELQIA